MPKHSAQPSPAASLRVHAEDRLRRGIAPPTQGGPVGTPALTLLHDMASSPASASDALKLLHELQVHQIELDLQQEQADQERQQFAAFQARYLKLFNLAPFAYLSLNPQGQVVDANQQACTWLGVAPESLLGQALADFVAPDCSQALQDALARLHQGHRSAALTVRVLAEGEGRPMRATITPDDQLVLMALMPAAS
jgi:PAS domain S-box-containing protein